MYYEVPSHRHTDTHTDTHTPTIIGIIIATSLNREGRPRYYLKTRMALDVPCLDYIHMQIIGK